MTSRRKKAIYLTHAQICYVCEALDLKAADDSKRGGHETHDLIEKAIAAGRLRQVKRGKYRLLTTAEDAAEGR